MIDGTRDRGMGGHAVFAGPRQPVRISAENGAGIGSPRGASSPVRVVFALPVLLWIASVTGIDARAGGDPDASLPDFRHGLENTRFVGEWTYEWATEPVEGLLIFRDGKFVSRDCLEWGYQPAPYYVRRDGDGVHFYARLPNPEHGTMWFRGVFDGERLRVDVHWKKERWYWTLEQRYRFTGRPVDHAASPAVMDSSIE